MTPSTRLIRLIRAGFPASPLPQRFLRARGELSPRSDTALELSRRLQGREWPEISINDWAMVGTPPCIARRYLEPEAFLYYVPSLLIGVYQCPEYLNFAVEGIIPDNQARRPRGEWWMEFSLNVSEAQKMAFAAFLMDIRPLYPEAESAIRADVEVAEGLWSK